MTIVFECSRPLVLVPCVFATPLFFRFTWLLFAVTWMRVPLFTDPVNNDNE